MEGKLVTQSVMRLAHKDKLGIEEISNLQDSINQLEILIDGLGFCLSEEGDLLSQWRGYASDATGVSIGFSQEYLEWLEKENRNSSDSLNLFKVEYEIDTHDQLISPTYQEIRQLFKIENRKHGLLELRSDQQIAEEITAKDKAKQNRSLKTISLFNYLFLLKSSAFKEEKEWRLVSYISNMRTGECSYRVTEGKIVPYRSYELRELEKVPILEVILGPKHSTPVHVIKKFLEKNGFGNDINIRRSKASYR
ncbi:DUF2971 domain-containing protein [Nitrosomonas sp.]|uniref:DUF2971 domain-containing protein n=1 Tax=Nitrosomonas sp. TaxID=42353 RepID=UPI0025F300D7|nr:DUF2971 domain-containing protein [Nitrosomonas sp.]